MAVNIQVLPINSLDAENEIRNLISEKSLKDLTSKSIRKHLEIKFGCPLDEYKVQIDEIILEEMGKLQKIQKDTKNENSKEADKLPDDDQPTSSAHISDGKMANAKVFKFFRELIF